MKCFSWCSSGLGAETDMLHHQYINMQPFVFTFAHGTGGDEKTSHADWSGSVTTLDPSLKTKCLNAARAS